MEEKNYRDKIMRLARPIMSNLKFVYERKIRNEIVKYDLAYVYFIKCFFHMIEEHLITSNDMYTKEDYEHLKFFADEFHKREMKIVDIIKNDK